MEHGRGWWKCMIVVPITGLHHNLYSLREKWCPTFSKKNFSGGVFSSRKSESTNNSIKRRLHATANLCDFYNIFCGVVSEWREKENGQNHKCSKGNVEMGWSKDARDSQSNELIVEDGMKDTAVCSSVWRMQMGRRLNALVTASQMNREARILCEDYFSKLKELIEVEVWSVYAEDDIHQNGSSSAMSVLNPPGSWEKGQQNKRLKSTSEKKCNQAKARKKKLSTHNLIIEEGLPKATNLEMNNSAESINLEVQRSTKVALKNANADFVQNFASFPMNLPYYGLRETLRKDPSGVLLPQGAPLSMNIRYGGSTSPGNAAPTLNLLPNSNRNNQSLSQSTIALVGYCPLFYYDPRTTEGELIIVGVLRSRENGMPRSKVGGV
ncbi:hypothetical protein Cgig2_031634 [Carnegiea gigantea]|uniref:Uncharacterized protein n=1 Tax=Carnegiea gigantea TaxID=171969 RepID=A0A9Q1K931_9CARY|nr:hypothetical protein Cgig2_031634 [Carnegiea gigantea]